MTYTVLPTAIPISGGILWREDGGSGLLRVQFREPAQSLPSDKSLIKCNHRKRSKFSYHHCVIIKKEKKNQNIDLLASTPS